MQEPTQIDLQITDESVSMHFIADYSNNHDGVELAQHLIELECLVEMEVTADLYDCENQSW